MKYFMAMLALLGVFASLAAQACEESHSEHSCRASHTISRAVHLCTGHEHSSISAFELHADHWSFHRHKDGTPCSCHGENPSAPIKTDFTQPAPERLPAVHYVELVPLGEKDLRIPPSIAPPRESSHTFRHLSTRISQEICVYLL